MSVTFGASSSSMVTLPRCQEEEHGYNVLTNETVLLSGKISVQASTVYGYNPTFTCVGTATERDSLVALIGSSGTLVINGTTHESMYIKSFGPAQMHPMSSYFTFRISFVKETT